MVHLTKTRIFVLMVLFLFFQSCQEDDFEVPEPVAKLSPDELVKSTQAWFDEGDDQSFFKNARRKKKQVEPQWQLAEQSEVEANRTIVSVPVFKEGSLHNNVQLITFHQDGEVTLGFVLEIIPDSVYREEHELTVGPDFQGRMKLYDKEDRLINVFTFENGKQKIDSISSRTAAPIKGMATLRTAGGEDPIYNCGCVLSGVTIYAPKDNGGYVYISNPEGVFGNGAGPTVGGGGGGAGGGSGTGGGAGGGGDGGDGEYDGNGPGSGGSSGGAGNYNFPVPVTPVPTVNTIKPQLNHLLSKLPNSRISTFVYKVQSLVDKKQLSTTETKKIGHAVQSVYMESVKRGYIGNTASYIVADLIRWQIFQLDVSLQKKLYGGSSLPEYMLPTRNCIQLKNTHGNNTYNLIEFYKVYQDRTREKVISEIPNVSITGLGSQPGGPRIRYVRDPLNTKLVIDLRHMLVIGYYGPLVGEGVEMAQWLAKNESAMDYQDYYSNALGYSFYQKYGSAIRNNPEYFVHYIVSFLSNRSNRNERTNPSQCY